MSAPAQLVVGLNVFDYMKSNMFILLQYYFPASLKFIYSIANVPVFGLVITLKHMHVSYGHAGLRLKMHFHARDT